MPTINIQNYLPHREPMLMADAIVEIGREHAVTSFFIKDDNIFVENGLFSEAGMIEHIAQTCSAIIGQDFGEDIRQSDDPGARVIGFITQIKKVTIQHKPAAGTEITSRATLISQFGEICSIFCETFAGNTLLATAEISLFIKAV